ncbi:4205_t:CDS:1, partial [Cetraspora pellucida]
MVTIENFNECFYDSDNENFYNKEAFENSSPEPNDIYNIAPSFSELELEEFDETDDIICQNVQELWEFWQKKECTCRKTKNKINTCFERIGFCRFFKRQEECRNMPHDDLDVWIKGQLASFAYSSELPKQKKKLQESDNFIVRDCFTYQYRYDAQYIMCLSTYLKLIGISSSWFDRIKAHIKNYGMIKPIHGNTGHSSIRPDHAIINDQVKQELNYYIRNYASFYGFPSPVRCIRHDAMSIILLPINTTYNSIYEEYIITIKSIKGENYKAIAYTTFLKIWKE